MAQFSEIILLAVSLLVVALDYAEKTHIPRRLLTVSWNG